MPGFRGMRTVGDPSFIPPTKFRWLQNVRLGAGDVKSRPGLAPFDTLAAPATWLTEINEEIQSVTLYLGPVTQWDDRSYVAGSPQFPGIMLLNYSRHDLSRIPAGSSEGADPDTGNQASSLFGLFPTFLNDGTDPDLGNTASQAASPTPYIQSDDEIGAPTPPESGWKKIGIGVTIPAVAFMQFSACIDAIVKWQDREGNDRWLCAGTHMGYVWSGVGNFVPAYYTDVASPPTKVDATGDPTVGGQPIFEVNFDTRNPLDRNDLLGEAATVETTQLFAGGLTEVFRMPAPGYERGAQTFNGSQLNADFDPAMYPNCEWVRSMVSVPRRADDLLTGDQITEETLYIGTVGGKVLGIDGSGPVADPTRKYGINDPDDGDVWSYDGISLEKVFTGVGHLVCVAATGDGGIIAAARTGARYLDEPGGVWQAVTYSPSFTLPATGNYATDFNYGYVWTSRATFQGKVYFYGYDLGAGLAAAAVIPQDFPGNLVLGVFDPGTLTITIIRTGSAFTQGIAGQTLRSMDYEREFASQVQPVLAAEGGRLLYLSAWSGAFPFDRVNVGSYDGSTFDDDAYEWPVSGLKWPVDLVLSGQRTYAVMTNPPSFWRLDPSGAVFIWDGTGGLTISQGKQSRAFVGP
jgi:hypothetical protein